MATKSKTKAKYVKKYRTTEMDSVYLMKMVLYLILGSQWLWLEQASGQRIPIPVGLLVGILFAMHDHFQIDRKIEYAVLLIAMFVGFVANIGIFITL
ncbi:hypothetical protein KDA23_06890 [Candidatus Saccharibacteria bacterium]|nr:hypothetical protein [Candidatus Saccharibacteria bacterium]